jgi:tRNA threonylcarbamoyladenosine biosynthesis protein TsaB
MKRDSKPVLYLDTTTSCLMMGLGQDDKLIAERLVQCDSHRYHSALIVPAIQDLLQESGLSVRDLSALGVNHGPGSFTGIRTGIITVRTMAQFLNLPVHVFNSFELLAFPSERPVNIWLDALRGRIYQAALHFDATGPVYVEAPRLGTLEEALKGLDVSMGLRVSPSLTNCKVGSSVDALPEHLFTPGVMAQLQAQYGNCFSRYWRDVRPLYLQEPSITLKKAKQT